MYVCVYLYMHACRETKKKRQVKRDKHLHIWDFIYTLLIYAAFTLVLEQATVISNVTKQWLPIEHNS